MWRSKARFVAAACGRGSGKTELARRRVVRFLPVKKPHSDPKYFYALPTYKQARRIAWRPIKALIPQDWIKGQPNETDMRIETVFGSTLYVVGLDKPQVIEGDQWDGGVIDESCDQKPGHFGLSILPALSHRDGWCWRIGVPKRVGVGASEFKKFFLDGKEPGCGHEHESYAWPSEDILTDEQLRWARHNLDAKDYNEQYRANWETSGGLCHYAFDSVLNVRDDLVYNPSEVLIIGSDFNVDPMAWVICQERNNNTELHVLDELWERNTNTQQCLGLLHERFRSHKAGFWFIGDASSRARNTRASASDYIQISNDKRFNEHVLSHITYPRANPRITDRFAACNAMFCNADQERRCLIHPRCKNLISDLEQRAYKSGSNEPNDYGDIGHITDALGYVIYVKWPLHVEIEESQSIGIEV